MVIIPINIISTTSYIKPDWGKGREGRGEGGSEGEGEGGVRGRGRGRKGRKEEMKKGGEGNMREEEDA